MVRFLSPLPDLERPQTWEPNVGHQLQAVRYIRERLRTRREGKFTQEEGASQEKWEEPDASDVEVAVWSEIREEGFGGKKLKTRDVKRLWRRRHTTAQDVERLELGCAGGVFKTNKRQRGALRRGCLGCGQRGPCQAKSACNNNRGAHRTCVQDGVETTGKRGSWRSSDT